MLGHTNAQSTKRNSTKKMYKVEGWSRNSHGNKKDLLFTSLYNTKEEAESAKRALIRLSKGHNFVPIDAECAKMGRPESAILKITNYIVC